MYKNTKLLLVFLSIYGFTLTLSAQNPIDIARSIADKIIKDTSFRLILTPVKGNDDIQIIDFSYQFSNAGTVYAISNIISTSDTNISLGISHSAPLTIYLNNNKVYEAAAKNKFKEIAYSKYLFADTIKLAVKKNVNTILLKSLVSKDSQIFMQVLQKNGYGDNSFSFSSEALVEGSIENRWLFCGPFSSADLQLKVEKDFRPYYKEGENYYTWQYSKKILNVGLEIPENSAYKKDAYLDWHYANGATMFGIQALAEVSGNSKYNTFVKKFCDFAIDNYELFRWQYQSLVALRGNYHKRMRLSMLDDSGGPIIPFLQVYINENDSKYWQFIEPVMNYVSNEQSRLDDGTFCRPEPQVMTLWADDMFMSIPALLRMAKITGNDSYYNDAANQILNFSKYLFNTTINLFHHGWFQKTESVSKVHWGRANGWVAWSTSEALLYLPKTHQSYKKILEIHKKHLDGLIKCQAKSGMWHQILDDESSYEETSCTAMFIIAISRGIKAGWLGTEYKTAVKKAWESLQNKIEPEGIVHGICKGTELSNNPDYYKNQRRVDNDPRGLGAVLTAAVEISTLNID